MHVQIYTCFCTYFFVLTSVIYIYDIYIYNIYIIYLLYDREINAYMFAQTKYLLGTFVV